MFYLENDQFKSAPGNNRLVYTTPAINTLFAGGMPLSSFESLDNVKMHLSVKTSVYDHHLTCAQKHRCKVNYSWEYTPIFHYLVPSMVYPGMNATVALNPKNTPYYKHPDELPVDLRIDGTSIDLSEMYDNESILGRDSKAYITGTVKTDFRNANGAVTAFFRGAGYAMNDTDTFETCGFDDVNCYSAKVMPTVSSISHNAGHAEGGQLMTIQGTSLDGAAVTVTVDDIPCSVQSISQEEVTCLTGKKTIDPNAQRPASYIGQQGLNLYSFSEHQSHDDWRNEIDSDSMISKTIYTAIDLA